MFEDEPADQVLEKALLTLHQIEYGICFDSPEAAAQALKIQGEEAKDVLRKSGRLNVFMACISRADILEVLDPELWLPEDEQIKIEALIIKFLNSEQIEKIGIESFVNQNHDLFPFMDRDLFTKVVERLISRLS
ncbi:MAG: hypothetical protein WCV72_00450 [Patescibacteria group bacterium]|jgi:hypothetical protein